MNQQQRDAADTHQPSQHPTIPNNQPKEQQEQRIGHYLLGKTLGKGTFGKVKQATHTLTNEKVAVKVLNKNRIEDDEDRQRLLREMEILRRVRHPNIIQLYEIMQTTEDIYLAVEYAEKGELFRLIIREERIKEQPAGRIFLQIVNAVEYLHRLGITHRDLKPQNVLLDFDYNVKLIDFGLSNYCEKGVLLETACGSPCYAPPEMVSGKSYNGFITDVWSMGIIFYVMLCGTLPFEDKTTRQLYQKIISGKFALPDFLSEEAKEATQAMLVTDPQKRIPLNKIRELPFFRRYTQLEPPIYGLMVGVHPMPIDLDLLHEMKRFIKDLDAARAEEDIRSNRHNYITTTYYLLQKQVLREGGKTNVDLQLYLQSNPDYQKDYGPKTTFSSKPNEQVRKKERSSDSTSRYEKASRSLLKRKRQQERLVKKQPIVAAVFSEDAPPPPPALKSMKPNPCKKFRIGDYTYLCRDYARRLNRSNSKQDSNRKFYSVGKSSPNSIKPNHSSSKHKKPTLNHSTNSEKKLVRKSSLRLKTEVTKAKYQQLKETMDKTKEEMSRSIDKRKGAPLELKVWDAYFKNNLKVNSSSAKKPIRSNVKERQRQDMLQQNIRQIKECFTKLPDLRSERKRSDKDRQPPEIQTARL